MKALIYLWLRMHWLVWWHLVTGLLVGLVREMVLLGGEREVLDVNPGRRPGVVKLGGPGQRRVPNQVEIVESCRRRLRIGVGLNPFGVGGSESGIENGTASVDFFDVGQAIGDFEFPMRWTDLNLGKKLSLASKSSSSK